MIKLYKLLAALNAAVATLNIAAILWNDGGIANVISATIATAACTFTICVEHK